MSWDHPHAPYFYVLDKSGAPTPATNAASWGIWFEKADRLITRTKIDDVTSVSTFFTSIDCLMWLSEDHEPVLWATMISGGEHHGLGRWSTSVASARIEHDIWCAVARGTITPKEASHARENRYLQPINPNEEGACRDKEEPMWLEHHVGELLDVSEQTLLHYTRLGILHPHRFTYHEETDRYSYRKPEIHRVVLYDTAEIAAVSRLNADLPRRGYRHTASLPQFIKPSHGAILDRYVMPGQITLLEFRARYGYRCKRRGKSYLVNRADGKLVCSELSSTKAWIVAHRLEQDRLWPILVARDAITERRFDAALKIAEQLTDDLAAPLRREIDRAQTSNTKSEEASETEEL